MTTDAQTQPNTLITSTWGQETNDRIIQIFANKAALVAGVTNWTPVVGSLAYTTAEKGLWRNIGTNQWESALARGKRGEAEPGTEVDISSYTTIILFNIGDIRYGCTYLINYSANPYTKSNSLSLWSGQVYIRQAGVNIAENNQVLLAGAGWPASIFSSVNQAGQRMIGPMNRSLPSAEVVWRGSTYPGMPVVTLTDIRVGVIEVGGPS